MARKNRKFGGVTLFDWIAERAYRRIRDSTAEDRNSMKGRRLIADYLTACLCAAASVESEIVVALSALAHFPGKREQSDDDREKLLYDGSKIKNWKKLVKVLNDLASELRSLGHKDLEDLRVRELREQLFNLRNDLVHPKTRARPCGARVLQQYTDHEDIDLDEAKKRAKRSVAAMRKANRIIHATLDALKHADRQTVLSRLLADSAHAKEGKGGI